MNPTLHILLKLDTASMVTFKETSMVIYLNGISLLHVDKNPTEVLNANAEAVYLSTSAMLYYKKTIN